MTDKISMRILNINDRINETCLRLGRNSNDIRLMAVSKSYPISSVEHVFKHGISLFGESRVQEAIDKFSVFKDKYPEHNTEIHLIGSLQRNKAKNAAVFFDCIQSVDRLSLIEELGKFSLGRNIPLMIYLEYLTGEESKKGFLDLDELFRAAEKVHLFEGLKPLGLMTMAPFTTDKKVIRASFRKCRLASEELSKRFGKDSWSHLSMGMSGDYEIALEEGTNLLRIGTAIFGEHE